MDKISGVKEDVRLYAKRHDSGKDGLYSFIVQDVTKATEDGRLTSIFAPLHGSSFFETDILLFKNTIFLHQYVLCSQMLETVPERMPVTLRPIATRTFKVSTKGLSSIQLVFQEFARDAGFDAVHFTQVVTGQLQATFCRSIHLSSQDSTAEDKLIHLNLDIRLLGEEGWQLNFVGNLDFSMGTVTSTDDLKLALMVVGSREERMVLSNQKYSKTKKPFCVRISHLEDGIFRLMPLFDDIFSGALKNYFSPNLIAIELIPSKRRTTCRIKLFFEEKMGTKDLMKWLKTLEIKGIGYGHQVDLKNQYAKISFKNTTRRILQGIYRDSNSTGVAVCINSKASLQRSVESFRIAETHVCGLGYGDMIITHSNEDMFGLKTKKSQAFKAFTLIVSLLMFDHDKKIGQHIELISFVMQGDDAYHRIEFTMTALKEIGLERLLEIVNEIFLSCDQPFLNKFGIAPRDFSADLDRTEDDKVKTPEAIPPLAAFTSSSSYNPCLLTSDYWGAVNSGLYFSPQEVFAKKENAEATLFLFPADVSETFPNRDFKVITSDDIAFDDIMKVMDLINDEGFIRLGYSKNEGKIRVDIIRWAQKGKEACPQVAESIFTLGKESFDLAMEKQHGIRSKRHYLALKPWIKCASYIYSPGKHEVSPEHKLEVRFHEGSKELSEQFVSLLVESDITSDICALELSNLFIPLVWVQFLSGEHIKRCIDFLKSSGLPCKVTSTNEIFVRGELPLFASFPNSRVQPSQFTNVTEFMRLKAQASDSNKPKRSFVVERKHSDPLFKKSAKFYESNFPIKDFNPVVSSFVEALIDRDFSEISVPFVRLEVNVFVKQFRVTVFVMEYFIELSPAEYSKRLAEVSTEIRENPGSRKKKTPIKRAPKKVVLSLEPESKPIKPEEIKLKSVMPIKGEEAKEKSCDETDWETYYEKIKDMPELNGGTCYMERNFLDICKEMALEFQPNFGSGYALSFADEGPIMIAKTWNGISALMDYALENMMGIIKSRNGKSCRIDIHPELGKEGSQITFKQAFDIKDPAMLMCMFDAFEALAYNMMHDCISKQVIRLGLISNEIQGSYIVFLDMSIPVDYTPEFEAYMSEFETVWNIVVKASKRPEENK